MSLLNEIMEEPDWSNSRTLLSEPWKNLLTPMKERLLIADGAVAFRNDVIKNLQRHLQFRVDNLLDISKLLEEIVSVPIMNEEQRDSLRTLAKTIREVIGNEES